MVVTQLEELEKSKFKVYIDYNYAFLLYRKDIEHYEVKEGCEIADYVYDKIIEDTVFRRAKQKALAVLKFKDRTEHELRGKLSDTGYPSEVIERTISYVKEYGYLSDERYIGAFVRDRMKVKSRRVIKTLLLQKGADKELVAQIMQEEYEQYDEEEDIEMQAIIKAVSKKTKNKDELTVQDKQKMIASLYRKGFELDKIKKVIL